MKLFKFENFQLTITEEALLIKAFRDLWERDDSNSNEKFFMEMGYVYFVYDPRSDFMFIVDEEDRIPKVKEEVGIEIKNISYVTSLATIHADGNPSLVISCMADYVSGEVKLQKEETDDFAWVSLQEAKTYDLIDGIYDEIAAADNKLKGITTEWKRT